MQRSLILIGDREGKIEAYDAQDGNVIFDLPVGCSEKQLRDIVAGPILAGHSIVASCVSGVMRSWRQPDFEENWSIQEPHLTHLVYNGVNKNVVAAGAGKILAIGVDSGQIQWRFHLGEGAVTSLVLRSGHVYAASSSGGLLVLNALTGKMVQWLLPRSRIVAAVHSNASGFYAVSEAGVIYGFQAVSERENKVFRDPSRGFIRRQGL